jgi:hypothetical protein
MIRHTFIGPAFPGCTDGHLSDVVATLRQLPKLVPWIRNLSVEKTMEWSETQAVVLIAEFDSQQDWERYMNEPKHLALGDKIKQYIDLSRMTVVQTGLSS